MSLPLFFTETITDEHLHVLDEDTSKHIIQVLRMKIGEQVQLTDGRGQLLTAEITDEHKKRCTVKTVSRQTVAARKKQVTIAMALLKNSHRFEWFLEKATEIGVSEIIPIITARTEKQHFRYDRMKNVLVSALLQSQQAWLPALRAPLPFHTLLTGQPYQQQFIAHCEDNAKRSLHEAADPSSASSIILIGPEGDFTPGEIQAALEHQFIPVALGDTRLRTETAGIVAATLLTIGS